MKLHVQPTLGCELEEEDDEEEESSEEGPFFGSGSTRSLSLIAMKPIASFPNAVRQRVLACGVSCC